MERYGTSTFSFAAQDDLSAKSRKGGEEWTCYPEVQGEMRKLARNPLAMFKELQLVYLLGT